jgi:probable HAF family extracellular repeat protein
MKRPLLSVALVALVLSPAHGAPIYSVTDLGSLGGGFTAAYGINDSGEVTGLSTGSDGQSHAFITGPNGAGMTAIDNSVTLTKGLAINASGQVIFGDGTTFFLTGPNGIGVSTLGGADPNTLGFSGSFAYGFGTVNASGQIAGTRDSQGNILSDGPTVNGANNSFDVGSHAYVTGPNGVGIADLGTLGGSNSFARGINDIGDVVGGSNLANTTWNNLDAPSAARRATFWDGGSVFDLNALLDPNDPFVLSVQSLTLDVAMGINDQGQIVADGFGYLSNGAFFNRAFLLSPTNLEAAIPEPGSLTLFAGALAAFVFTASRWRKGGGD